MHVKFETLDLQECMRLVMNAGHPVLYRWNRGMGEGEMFKTFRHSWSSSFTFCLWCLVALQDLRYFKSQKTDRGLLQQGWINTQEPIMCSYKLVTVKFEVWGLQTRVEQFVHKVRTKYIICVICVD